MSVLVFSGAEPKAMATYRERGEAVSVLVFIGAEPKAMATYRERGGAVSAPHSRAAFQETGSRPESWKELRAHDIPSHSKTRPHTKHSLFRVSRGLRPMGPSLGREGLGGIETPFKKVGITTLRGWITIGEREHCH